MKGERLLVYLCDIVIYWGQLMKEHNLRQIISDHTVSCYPGLVYAKREYPPTLKFLNSHTLVLTWSLLVFLQI